MGDRIKKENILVVHNYYQIPGGEDTVVANEKKMLENHGHKVILYSRSNAELKQMSKIRKLFLPFTTVFNPRTYKEIKKLIRQENIEVVHVHNTLNLISPAVYYAARSMKVPVIQTVHNFRLLCPGATFYRDGHICEDCVQHEDTLIGPFFQVTIVWNLAAQVIVKFLIYVDQGWRDGYSWFNAETESVCLTWFVIWILADDHTFDV